MSKEKPKKEYTTKVKKFGNGARIKAYKKHIGKKVKIIIEERDLDDMLELNEKKY